MNHSCKQHVIKGIDPQRGQQHKDLGDQDQASALLVVGRHGAGEEGAKFPDRGHADDPAELLLVEGGLGDVEGCQDTEEDREGKGSAVGGIVVVEGMTGTGRNVAILVRCDCHGASWDRDGDWGVADVGD